MYLLDSRDSATKLGTFFNAGREKMFSNNEVVIELDEHPKGAYWITAGHVRAASINDAGEERIHHIFKTNELFPAGWIFAGTPIIAAYMAMGDVTVRIQPIEAFEAFILKYPKMLEPIVHQLLTFYNSVYNLNLGPARQRVAYRLLVLSDRFSAGVASQDGFVRIDLSQTQQELASSVRLSRETTGKILGQLEDEDVIMIGRKTIRVQPDKLKAVMLEERVDEPG